MEMIPFAEALRMYEESIDALPIREISTRDALHRVLGEPVLAPRDLPPFSQSAMDGYALRSGDTKEASPEKPVRIRVKGVIHAARAQEEREVGPYEAYRIFTGAPVPIGADTILRQEEAQVEKGWLVLKAPLPPGADLREKGEEVKRGDLLLPYGRRIRPGGLGAVAAAGVESLKVYQEPRITLIVTGDEIVQPGKELLLGEVYDANSSLVTSWLRSQGYRKVQSLVLGDDRSDIKKAIRNAFETSDLVLSTGGVSVGKHDYIVEVAETLGVQRIFWKVKQKPGKPLFFGMFEKIPFLGLPGNPGAVFVCLSVHVACVLDLLEGVQDHRPSFLKGKLLSPLRRDRERVLWIRSKLHLSSLGEVLLEPLPLQRSHMISNLVQTSALLLLEEGEGEALEGSEVSWVPIDFFPG